MCQLLLMQPLFFSALPSSQIKTKQRAGQSKQTFSIILPEYNRRIAQCILQTNTTDFNPEGSGSSVQGSLNPGCSRLVFWKCKHCWALLWIPPSLPMDWRFLSCRELSAKSVHHWIFGGINGISVDSVVDSDRTVDDASKPRSEIRQRVISNNRQWRRKRPFGKIESALELNCCCLTPTYELCASKGKFASSLAKVHGSAICRTGLEKQQQQHGLFIFYWYGLFCFSETIFI